ncbi:MAG: DUF4184 family protein [Planctomycetota bacterium]
MPPQATGRRDSMPFTAAHPAAAIPLVKPLGRFGVLSALVIGSLAPDLAYFLPLPISRAQSHSLAALGWFCLPVGGLTYLYFHLVLRPFLGDLIGPGLRSRLLPDGPNGVPPSSVAAVVASLLIGAVTHLAWDSVTHPGGFVVEAVPRLRAPLFSWGGYTFFGYKLLQHGSTLLGLGLIAWWTRRRWMRSPAPASPTSVEPGAIRRLIALAAMFVPPIFVTVRAWAATPHRAAGPLAALQDILGHAVFTGGKVAVAALVLASLVWRWLGTRDRRQH